MATVTVVKTPALHESAGASAEPDAFSTQVEPGAIVCRQDIFFGSFFVRNDAYFYYDFSDIPRGAVITDAKLEMKAFSTRSNVFSMHIDTIRDQNLTADFGGAYENGGPSQGFVPAPFTSHGGSRFNMQVFDSALASVSPENSAAHDDSWLLQGDKSLGNALKAHQSFSISPAGNGALTFVNWFLGWQGTTLGSGTLVTRVYRRAMADTAGVSHWAGALLGTSTTQDLATLNPGAPATKAFFFAVGERAQIEAGDEYVLEIEFQPTGGQSSDVQYIVGRGLTLPGGAYPRLAVADSPGSRLQGFANGMWHAHDTGLALFTASHTGGGAIHVDLTPNAFVAGTNYVWGSSKYSPDVVADLTGILNAAIENCDDAQDPVGAPRTACLRWLQDDSAILEFRAIHSTRSSTPTLPGLFGLVLTMEYDDMTDAVCSQGTSVALSVDSLGQDASPAVASDGAEAVQAALHLGLETSPAVSSETTKVEPAVSVTAPATVGECE